MIDEVTAVLAWLKANSSIAALVGSNVFAPVIPEGMSLESGVEFIVIHRRGGLSNPDIAVLTESIVEVEAWSLDTTRTRLIYGTVRDVMHGACGVDLSTNGYIVRCQEVLSAQDIYDPNTSWPSTFGSFQLVARPAVTGGIEMQLISYTGAFDGTNADFDLTITPSIVLMVFYNGLLQGSGDYTLVGNHVHFFVAPVPNGSQNNLLFYGA